MVGYIKYEMKEDHVLLIDGVRHQSSLTVSEWIKHLDKNEKMCSDMVKVMCQECPNDQSYQD